MGIFEILLIISSVETLFILLLEIYNYIHYKKTRKQIKKKINELSPIKNGNATTSIMNGKEILEKAITYRKLDEHTNYNSEKYR